MGKCSLFSLLLATAGLLAACNKLESSLPAAPAAAVVLKDSDQHYFDVSVSVIPLQIAQAPLPPDLAGVAVTSIEYPCQKGEDIDELLAALDEQDWYLLKAAYAEARKCLAPGVPAS